MELSHNLFTDKFNGVKEGSPLDMRSNLKIGATLFFSKRKKKDEDIIIPVAPVIHDTRLREIPWLPYMLPEAEETKDRTVTGRAFLDFPVNETTI